MITVAAEQVWLHRLGPGAVADLSGREGWVAAITDASAVSLACEQRDVAGSEATAGPFRVLQIGAVFEQGATGVIAGVSRPLAESGISIFAMSGFDACYVLVPVDRFAEAIDALTLAGLDVSGVR